METWSRPVWSCRTRRRWLSESSGRLLPAQVDATSNVCATEDVLRIELVVRAAAHAEVRGDVGATERAWMDVIELEECPRGAAFALLGDEGAAFAVALEHLAAYGVRDVPLLRGTRSTLRT